MLLASASASEAPKPPHLAVSGDTAEQLAQPLVQLVGGNGGGSVTVRLHPADLGQVEIRLDRAPGGETRVTLRADRAETLRALAGERAHIDAALDRAGVPQDRRRIVFDFEPQMPSVAATIPHAPPAEHLASALSGPAHSRPAELGAALTMSGGGGSGIGQQSGHGGQENGRGGGYGHGTGSGHRGGQANGGWNSGQAAPGGTRPNESALDGSGRPSSASAGVNITA